MKRQNNIVIRVYNKISIKFISLKKKKKKKKTKSKLSKFFLGLLWWHSG